MCKAHRFAPVPKKIVTFPAWLTLPQNTYIWQGKSPGDERQTSSGLGGTSAVKHASTCSPLSTWVAPLTSLWKQACSCQGLQEDCVLVSSCRQLFQLLLFFAYLLKRTLSKSVLVGWESFDDSELQSTTVLLRAWKKHTHMHTGASEGEPAVFRFLSSGLRKYLFSVPLSNRMAAEAVCHGC